jgi:N6-L-threonylcarbamoyladenine synthase
MVKYILGIESTAHTFGVGIVTSKGEILANERDTLKVESGGFLPREAAEHHYTLANELLDSALNKANLSLKDISLIGFSQGPGIGQCLQSGATFAKYLARRLNKPLIGVNHCLAHIEIGKLTTKLKDPLTIFVSGANTQIIAYKNKYYRVYGETQDMGLGNALDQFGRELGMPFPAGPMLDKLYFEGKQYIELPYTVKGMDLSFAGILTSAKMKINKYKKEDLIYSFLHTCYAMLLEVVERALYYAKKKEIMLVGGVAASKSLRGMLEALGEQRKVKLGFVPLEFAGDNGAMIAWQAYLQYFRGKERPKFEEMKCDPNQRLDHIKITYMK